MWEDITRLAVENGLFALLFCTLLFYILKDAKKREEKYVKTISELGQLLKTVNEIKEDTQRLLKNLIKKENQSLKSSALMQSAKKEESPLVVAKIS